MTAIPPRTRMPVPEALARPNVVAPQPYSLPTPTRFRLSNGAKGLAYDLPGQYVLSVRMAIPMPLRVEPREVEGVATIMARTLDEGTARHTSVAFARLLERRGVAIGCGVGDSGLSVELDVAKHNLAYGLDLLRQCLAEPAFPEDEVARQIATRLAEIEQERSVASHRAAAEFAATFFDPDARAARPVGGTADTVAAITREAVVAFHARHVAPAEATVVVAGDLAGLDVVSEVEATLGQWQTPAGYLSPGPWQPTLLAEDRARIVVVDRPGSVQTELMVGAPGPDRHHPKGWAPYPLLGFLVGGSPTARIDTVLREDKGYTYGIRSTFRPRRRGGIFVTAGSVRSEVSCDALRLLLDVLDGGRDGFTSDEVDQAAQFLVLTAPSRYATADTIADEAASLSYDGLDTEFTSRNLGEVARMDADRAGAAYREFVDGRWTVVLVGDAAGFVADVRALGRGDVTVVPN
ncbi:MAG TPA: pitrilysin family protein [Dermatophilaceae bacterium]|nr:pitrilysin family protein [Dermatophilaceae bacterium]